MRTIAVLLAICALLATGARSEEDTADEGVDTFSLILRSDDSPKVLMTTVVDARTGRPIADAIVRGYRESVDGRQAAVNALILTMTTDAYGLAVGQVDTKALGASHWIVSAAGYRPYAEYHGFWPPERVDLEPATPVAVRILGPYGDPVVGAAVEGYSGCPHAPPAVAGRTDETGVFRAADGSPDGFSLWVRAPGCASRSQDLPAVFGDEPCMEVLPPGIAVHGRLLDGDGRPIPGAVLRGGNYPRGPATLTDLEGRFVLAGLDPEESVWVFHPTLHLDAPHTIDRVAEDVPLALVWALDGLGPAMGEYGTLVVRARDAGGRAVENLKLLVLASDGQGQDAATDGAGDASLDLPAGTYRIRGDDPFGPFDVAEATVVVPTDGEVALDLALSPRPRLRIKGDVPPDLYAIIVAAGRVHSPSHESEEGAPASVWLPAEARAVVCLRNDEQAWAHFVPVGPVVDGFRSAVLDVPPAHRIRLTNGDVPDGATAALAPRAYPAAERWLRDIAGSEIALRWGGHFDLTVRSDDGTSDRFVPIDLPPLAEGSVERQIDLGREGQPVARSGEAHLIVKRADGRAVPEMEVSGGRVGAAWSGFQGTWDTPIDVWAPARVLLIAPGLHPLQLDVIRPADHDVVFPAAGIDLTTVDASGAPVASAVLVNGVLSEAPEGQLSMRGFPPGDHAVVVQRTSWPPTVSESMRWRFRLSEGQVLTKTIRIP